MSHDRGCPCGREKYEYDDCTREDCYKKETIVSRNYPEINIVDIVDNDDGSCTVAFEMDYETLKIFAGIGINKVLLDSANKVIEENRGVKNDHKPDVSNEEGRE